MQFSNAFLTQLLAEAEEIQGTRTNLLFERFALDITAGTALYTLPTGIKEIIEVSWKGCRLEVAGVVAERDPWNRPGNLGTQGTPRTYSLADQGFGQISFFPRPAESIVAVPATINTKAGIETQVIVSAYMMPDPSSITRRVPAELRRILFRYYAMAEAYGATGPNYNKLAAQYFRGKYETFRDMFEEVYRRKYKAIEYELGDNQTRGTGGRRPARPSMPTTGPWSF